MDEQSNTNRVREYKNETQTWLHTPVYKLKHLTISPMIKYKRYININIQHQASIVWSPQTSRLSAWRARGWSASICDLNDLTSERRTNFCSSSSVYCFWRCIFQLLRLIQCKCADQFMSLNNLTLRTPVYKCSLLQVSNIYLIIKLSTFRWNGHFHIVL